jgi:hypothetical protein
MRVGRVRKMIEQERNPTMRRRLFHIGWLAAVVVLGFAGAADADVTIGSTGLGSTSTFACSGAADVFAEATSDPSTPYSVPAGGGQLTQWQTNTTGASPGAPITLVVLRPTGGGNYTVVGVDPKTLPSPLPSSNIATFTLATPIAVTGGDTLGLYADGGTAICFSNGPSVPAADTVTLLGESTTPATGQSLPSRSTSPGGHTVNVAATIATQGDVGVTTSTAPANPMAGGLALLSSTVTNRGPGAPVTFTDNVPSGLKVDSALAAGGSCSTGGQTVTCTVTGVAAGQSALVDIVVTPSAAGSYANGVSVAAAPGLNDPNSTNNAATAILSVAPTPPTPSTPPIPPTPKCVVPKLKGISLPFATQLVHLLGCTAGSVRHVHSKSVQKGYVSRTVPGPGSYAAGDKIALIVSSGPAHKHHKKH